MPIDDESLEQDERALRDEQARAAALKKRIDALDRETDPPHPPIDHANDGGVI